MTKHNQNTTNATFQKNEARLKRIWDTLRWDEEINQITFVTNEAEEGLLDAYFAERKEREVPSENNTEVEPNRVTYNYSNDGLIGSFAATNGITTEELYDANPELPDPRQIPANRDFEVIIPNSEETAMVTEIYYEPTNKVNLGSDAYLVVKGFALKDKTATIQVFEKSPYLLMEAEDTPLTFLEYASLEDENPINSNQTMFKAVFNNNNEAIVKIQLRPEKPEGENAEDTEFKEWEDKFSPPKQDVEDYTITPSQGITSNSLSGLGEFQLNGETTLSDTQLPPNGGYSLSMGNDEDDVYIPIVDPLWLLVKVEGNKGSYERRFPEVGSSYFQLQNKNKIAPWMEIAWGELGVYEGDQTNGGFERVREFFLNGAGQALHPVNHAWCSSFTNWVFIETNRIKGTNFSTIPLNANINNPALAINWFNQSRYPGGVRLSPNEKPPYGSVLIMKKLNNYSGHASFVIDYIESGNQLIFKLLGGNQTHRVQVETYVFNKSESKYLKGDFELLGFVLPKEYLYNENNELFYQYQSDAPSNDSGPTE